MFHLAFRELNVDFLDESYKPTGKAHLGSKVLQNNYTIENNVPLDVIEIRDCQLRVFYPYSILKTK